MVPNLVHAPHSFKSLWEGLNDAQKKKVSDHWEFTADAIIWKGKVGDKTLVLEFEKYNLTVDKSDLKDGKIEEHDGEFYFQRAALAKYAKAKNLSIPTDNMYEAILLTMPAGDFTARGAWCKAGYELMCILGVPMSGFRYSGTQGDVDVLGMVWTCTPMLRNLHSWALTAGYQDMGGLGDYGRGSLLPVRTLRTPAWQS